MLDHFKINIRDIFLDTSAFKNRKAKGFVNRDFENVQYFCLTETSVAQMKHSGFRTLSASDYSSEGVLGGVSLWTWPQGRSA